MTDRPEDEESESLTRRILTLGLGAYFLTEDTVRRYVKDAKIPRNIAQGIVHNATKGKEELYAFVARELSGFLKQLDLQAELDRFVRSHKVRINAEIEFLPRPTPPEEAEAGDEGERPLPEFEWNVSLKRPDDEQATS
ncbi:MAG: hypothetical protein KIT58_22655 [Planctomycetota bacterium]|nr:hypothetical protein [Planctomycetota bacterium]